MEIIHIYIRIYIYYICMYLKKKWTYNQISRIFFRRYCVGCESKQPIFLKLKLQFLSCKPRQTIGLEV